MWYGYLTRSNDYKAGNLVAHSVTYKFGMELVEGYRSKRNPNSSSDPPVLRRLFVV